MLWEFHEGFGGRHFAVDITAKNITKLVSENKAN
jgi:hypothetical protein